MQYTSLPINFISKELPFVIMTVGMVANKLPKRRQHLTTFELTNLSSLQNS